MPEIVVATFNVHGGVDGWGRPFDVAAACRRLDADVLVLQEMWSPMGVDGAGQLAGQLGYRAHAVSMAPGRLRPPASTARRRWGPRWPRREQRGLRALSGRGASSPVQGTRGTIGLALLSRLPVRRVDDVDLGRMAGDRCRRRAVVAEVEVDGSALLVVGTHMSHLRHASPIQFGRLRRALPSPASSDAPVVMGDMNLWGPPLVLLLHGWRRAVRGRTWPAWRPLAQSDHILVPPGLVVRRGEILRAGNSDHLAVRATLDVP